MSKVHEIVTEKIVALLEKGEIPWRKPWSVNAPRNLVSKKAYRGINVFLLGAGAHKSPYWVTYKQAADLGGNVRKGEKSTLVVFWTFLDSKKEKQANGKPKQIPFLRYYCVFNVGQCDGLEKHIPAAAVREHTPIAAAESIVAGYENGPTITHGGNRACYSPSLDAVNIPVAESFKDGESFYHTLFHELVHSTGHDSRLARDKAGNVFGNEGYAQEELVAEMGAAFLSGEAGFSHIENPENVAAYIQTWLKALKNDVTLVVKAASKAQKAADHILNRDAKPEAEESEKQAEAVAV